MATHTKIKPSPEARRLFCHMVNRADPETLHLPIKDTLELAVERTRAGYRDESEIEDLMREEWIDQASDGGWLLH